MEYKLAAFPNCAERNACIKVLASSGVGPFGSTTVLPLATFEKYNRKLYRRMRAKTSSHLLVSLGYSLEMVLIQMNKYKLR